MKIETVFPKKIVNSVALKKPKFLLRKTVLQPEITTDNCSYIKNGFVILDFGQEYYGEPHLVTSFVDDFTPIKARVRYGESLSECCSSIGENNATNDHSLRDFEIMIPSLSNLSLPKSGFRFIRIDFLDETRGVNIKAIALQIKKDERKPIYIYQGKDELIKRIFDAAKRTVDLCSLNGYVWDGIKRDELVWAGDLHPEALALFTLYGRSRELEASIDFLRKGHKLPKYMNNFSMYSLWWIAVVADYYLNDKNNERFVRKQMSYIQDLIKQYDETIKEDGDMNFPHYFVDWPTVGSKDELAGCRAIAIFALNKAKTLQKAFNLPTNHSDSALRKLNKIDVKALQKKQVIGLKYMATGNISDEEYQLLSQGGTEGISTFMSYYILSAVASRDEKLAINMMKEYYGAMLDLGATTFFEDFDMKWVPNTSRIDEFAKKGQNDFHRDFGKYCYEGYRHSLCHGWSAGVIKFIKEHC